MLLDEQIQTNDIYKELVYSYVLSIAHDIKIDSKELERTVMRAIYFIYQKQINIETLGYSKLVAIILMSSEANLFVLGLDNKVQRLSESSYQYKLIRLYESNPNIINDPRLGRYRESIRAFLESQSHETSNLYQSSSRVASQINIERHFFSKILINSYKRLTQQVFLDKNGKRVIRTDLRIRLITLSRSPKFESRLRSEEKQLVEIFIKNENNTFCFDYQDITDYLGLKTNNPYSLVIQRIERIIEKFSDDNYFDDKGDPIIKHRLKLIITLKDKCLLEKVLKKLSEKDQEILKELITVNQNGVYNSYKTIEQRLPYKHFKRTIARTIEIIQQILED